MDTGATVWTFAMLMVIVVLVLATIGKVNQGWVRGLLTVIAMIAFALALDQARILWHVF